MPETKNEQANSITGGDDSKEPEVLTIVHKVNALHSAKEGALLDSGANLSVTHYFG